MTASRTVTVGGNERNIERASARKASRALAILRHIGNEIPELARAWADADKQYRETHVLELTRVEARLRFPPSPLLDPDTRAPIREPEYITDPDPTADTMEDGSPGMIPNPRAGELVVVPSAVDHMTEADWEQSGQRLRLPEAPALRDLVPIVFGRALELAEEHVYRLLALFLISNEEVKRRRRDNTLTDALSEQADDLIDDAFGDEILELAVVCGELVDDQFVRKARELGERAGNALRLFGLDPNRLHSTPTNGPTTSTPSSSTDGPTDSDGDPTPSSTPNGSSSNGSEPSTKSEQPLNTPSNKAA